jgi:cytochrome c-type biogenesis protein CcmH/NrfG
MVPEIAQIENGLMAHRPTQTAPFPPGQRRRSDRELLAGLGLPERASSRDVESAHDRIVAFLEGAPSDLAAWARREAAAADEAYALLAGTGPEAAGASGGDPQEDRPPATLDGSGEHGGEPLAARPRLLAALRGNRRRQRVALVVAAIAAVAVVVGVYRIGGDSGASGGTQASVSGAAPTGQVDQDRVAELTRKIAANPKDVASFTRLGDLYFQAGDYASAADWMERAVKLRPANVTARLALGAAWFNLGRRKDAEQQWLRVVVTNPRNVEAHYDLGFLYLSASPPDMARVRAEWGKVVELAPKSDVAKTVAAHLDQLDKPSSAPSADGK